MPDIGRLIEVRGVTEGTGYLICSDIVLTAWHLVRPLSDGALGLIPIRLQRDITNASKQVSQFAKLIWPKPDVDPGSDLDYALLQIVGPRRNGRVRLADADVCWRPIGNWGELQVTAVGYPDLAIDPQTGRRDTKGISGWIQAADRARSISQGRGTLTMRMRAEDCPAQPPAIAWPAMSGAPVFAEDALVGIIGLAGLDGNHHQLRVLPIDRFFEIESVTATVNSVHRSLPKKLDPSSSVPMKTEFSKKAVFTDKLLFKFENEINLQSSSIKAVLGAYYPDLSDGKLDGFRFTEDNLEFRNSEGYLCLRNELQQDILKIAFRRKVEKYEKWLIEGILLTLNEHYLSGGQVHFCYQSLFWLCRSIRVTLLSIFYSAGLDIRLLPGLKITDEEMVFADDPINYFVQNKFYGAEMMKIDLWNPNNDVSTSVRLPINSYIGKWFQEHPQISGPLRDHWSDNDYFNFIYPQMLLRHFLGREPLIQDWTELHVGAG